MLRRLKVSWFFIGFFFLLPALGMGREAFALLLALTIHEAGHILVAVIMGCKVEKLYILPLGGYMHLDRLIELEPEAEQRIALAGPMANLLAAALTMALVRYIQQHEFIYFFLRANLTLMAFNLLPALPLDGGRVLRAKLTLLLSFYRATQTVIFSGRICGVALLGLGGYFLLLGRPNPTVIAAGVFLLYNAHVEKKQLLVPLIRYVLNRQKRLRAVKLASALTLVAAPGAKVNEVLKHIRPQKYYQVSILDDDFKIAGTLTEYQLLAEIMSGAGQQSLQDLVKRKDE